METQPNKAWPLVRALETYSWLEQNLPAAVEWFTLWRIDDASKRQAVRMSQDLPPHRRHHLIQARSDVERESALGLLAELLAARAHAELSLEASDVHPEIVARIAAKRTRLDDLIDALQVDSEDGLRPEPKP